MLQSPNFEHESRVVYKSLSRMTNDFSLLQTAYQHWLNSHSHSALDPVAFAESLKSYVGLNDDLRRTLIIALHASSGRSMQELDPVPDSLKDATANKPVPVQQAAEPASNDGSFSQSYSAHWTIGSNFMKGLVGRLKNIGSEELLELQEILIEDDFTLKSKGLVKMLKSWARSGFSTLDFPADITPEECSECAHFLYLMTCEVLGPPRADVVLDQLIRQLKGLPEAMAFDPGKLL